MALDDQEQYEQGEQVRQWLRNNGSSVIGGIAVGLALIAGWQWWQKKQEMHGQAAAAAYAQLTDAVRDNADARRVGAFAKSLQADYAKSTYSTLASLRLAAYQMDHGDAKSALATLDSAPATTDAGLSTLVRLRAARLLLNLGRPADALARVQTVTTPDYASIVGEIRGDADVALGRIDAARQDYIGALQHLPDGAPNREILEMKLADIGGVAPKPEAKKA
jgi:predicted negative regulator of RcsB-dependent stress response